MRVFVIGAGGREHTLVWALGQSPLVTAIFCAPGNGGTATAPKTENIALGSLDFPALAEFAVHSQVDWTLVGPEQPLAEGIVDYFRERGLAILGPTQAEAQLESSKYWAKQLMQEAGIPTAAAQTFGDRAAAQMFLTTVKEWPVVLKADGLAQGKGVVIAETLAEAEAALGHCFKLSAQVMVEQFLPGVELSVLALTDGQVIVPLLPAQDHKRIGEGDTGANTGGMGTYSPVPLATPKVMAKVYDQVLLPTLKSLQARGMDYRGVIYAGLMIDAEGNPSVVEFNCRFGDPETQVVLPLLTTDFALVCQAMLSGTLGEMTLTWQEGACACVVVAAPGYPGPYPQGALITGVEAAGEVMVFQAGTVKTPEGLRTQGGRVLGVTGRGKDLSSALAASYQALTHINFPGMYYRRDIGFRALTP
jgi:phosphoribosylamine---glycine ligase